MTLKYFNVKNGLSTGNIFLHSGNSNIVANTFIGNLSVTGLANLGNVANINIQGGSNGYVLKTDGAGNLSWVSAGGYGNANVATFLASFGSNTLVTTGNITAGNANLGNVVKANYFVGDGTQLTGLTATVANLANTVTVNAQPNITSVGILANLQVSGDTSIGGNLSVTGNLTVSGTVTTVNSSTVNINDVNIVLANNATTAAQANGGGLTINGANASMVYNSTSNAFVFSHPISANGALLTSIAGANVTGFVPNANVANTALSVAGANVTGFVPNANVANTAFSVAGANVTGYVPNANIANTALSVAAANVTGLGNLATLNKDGNSSNILYGNGVFASAPVTYGNSNVATYLPTYTGNLSPGNITVSGKSNLGNISNVYISGGNSGYLLQTDGAGNLSWINQSSIANSSSVTVGDVYADSFVANGSQTTFTLSSSVSNKKYLTVHIDGIYQTSDVFTVSGNVMTLVAAPVSGSVVEVSTINPGAVTTAGTVTASAQPNVTSLGTLTGISIAGNIIPTSDVTYSLGNSTNRFKDLFLSGNTIVLGGAIIKSDANTGAVAIVPQPTANTPNPTGVVITGSGTVATIATTGGNVTSNAISNVVANSTTVTTAPQYGTITLVQTGNITTPFTGIARFYPIANLTVTNVFASLGTASSTNLGFMLKKNGSNVGNFTVTANTYRLSGTSANISVLTTDYLTLDITSGTGATDLKVDLQYKLQ